MIKENIKFIVTFDFENENGIYGRSFVSFKNDNEFRSWVDDMEMMAGEEDDDEGGWSTSIGDEICHISNLQVWDVRADRTAANKYNLP